MNRKSKDKKALTQAETDSMALYNGVCTLQKMMINENSQACSLDEIPEGVGEFGLENTNPIPVCGIFESNNYLSKLQLENGDKITWKRVCSVGADNIKCPIDCYQLFDNIGNEITYLYISPYHHYTSNKAPKGFILT